MKADVVVGDWVNWIAQDANGKWWQYENEPAHNKNMRLIWCRTGGDMEFLYQGIPPKDFTQELYEWK